jgi:hypothetical protein
MSDLCNIGFDGGGECNEIHTMVWHGMERE